MKWYLIILIPLVLMISACSFQQADNEPKGDNDTAPAANEIPEPIIATSTPTTILQIPTQAASPTKAPTKTALPTDAEPTPVGSFSTSQIAPGQDQAFSFQSNSGEEILYWIYLPEVYDEAQEWPLLISLHGFLGFNPSLDKVQGQYPPAWIAEDLELPFIVIAPKAPSGSWEKYHQPMEELLESLNEQLSIDPDAHFLTGLSAGTIGVWQWALAFPDRFKGISAIAGGLSMNPNDSLPGDFCVLADLPVWVSHSEIDTHAPIESSRLLVSALEECGSTVVQFNTYTDLSHIESISNSYEGPELYDWMLSILK